MLQPVLAAFGLPANANIISFGSGLINNTWKIEDGANWYILQRINNTIFKDPYAIAHNINSIALYLKEKEPGYLFPVPVSTSTNNTIYEDAGQNFFRLIPFVEKSHTADVLTNSAQAYEAALQFGKFTSLLHGFNYTGLKTTLPDFHNLTLRYTQFENALTTGNADKIVQSKMLIEKAKMHYPLCNTFEMIKSSPDFHLRVTHHDTKISNVLLDENEKGLCVIDLDTVMPGYFISDAGDMMRTYLSPVSEEESDYSKIEIRTAYFEALAKGYLSQMKHKLSTAELAHFIYAGKFMIYMQALRFLTDHINNDVYYGAKYEGHNFVRAGNQFTLLHKLIEKEAELNSILLKL